MKRENRVFFVSDTEALEQGYRPCGDYMREEHKKWFSLMK
jgi:methylphosphotriester-DNA--protein-cysteine methyltransferase